MSPYTVVLLRPEYLGEATEEDYGQDIYVALLEAENMVGAVELAQIEASLADKKEGLKPQSPADYKLCVLFQGHSAPALFGWQL